MNFLNTIRNMLGINNSASDNVGQHSLAKKPETSVSYLEEYLEDHDGTYFLDLDKFYEDIQESNTSILQNKTVEVSEVNLPTDSIIDINESSIPRNPDFFYLTNDIINISSDEESHIQDMSSIEDDIPLNILIKHKNDNINTDMRLGLKNSNSIKLVNILPCGDVHSQNKTFDDYLVSDGDFKMIDSSLDEHDLEAHDDDTGYHSSDFEFITESEAKTAGIVRNKKEKATRRCFSNRNTYHGNTSNAFEKDNLYSNDYRKNHVIPAGDSYIKLFQGHYAPLNSGFMENKAFHVSKMSIDFEGVGFNMRMHYKEKDNAEYRDEANNVAQMIPRLYPNENKRKRCRCQKDNN